MTGDWAQLRDALTAARARREAAHAALGAAQRELKQATEAEREADRALLAYELRAEQARGGGA